MKNHTQHREHKLSNKERRFADEYLVDSNAKQAYIRAGYSCNGAEGNAIRLLQKDKVQKYLAKEYAKLQVKNGIDREFVIKNLLETAQIAGNKGDLPTKTRCFELVGKTFGLFVEKLHTTSDEQVALTENQRLEAEIIAEIRRSPEYERRKRELEATRKPKLASTG